MSTKILPREYNWDHDRNKGSIHWPLFIFPPLRVVRLVREPIHPIFFDQRKGFSQCIDGPKRLQKDRSQIHWENNPLVF